MTTMQRSTESLPALIDFSVTVDGESKDGRSQSVTIEYEERNANLDGIPLELVRVVCLNAESDQPEECIAEFPLAHLDGLLVVLTEARDRYRLNRARLTREQ